MKNILLCLFLCLLSVSCSESRDQGSKEKVYPFEKIRESASKIKSDTVFSNHIEDIHLPLNKSMARLKKEIPEFYKECMQCSTDKELTLKLKMSREFRKISKEEGLILSKIETIRVLK